MMPISRTSYALAPIGLIVTACGPNASGCEAAIKADLVAPSTYERIEVGYCSDTLGTVSYDAKNRAGVPLRKKATCSRDTSSDKWQYLDMTGY